MIKNKSRERLLDESVTKRKGMEHPDVKGVVLQSSISEGFTSSDNL